MDKCINNSNYKDNRGRTDFMIMSLMKFQAVLLVWINQIQTDQTLIIKIIAQFLKILLISSKLKTIVINK